MATDIAAMGDIALDEFRRGPLGRWLDDKSSAHAAASEALWLATCRHARKHCTILVACPGIPTTRLVREKLDAYFCDEPSLMIAQAAVRSRHGRHRQCPHIDSAEGHKPPAS
jgi:hypothetical protein